MLAPDPTNRLHNQHPSPPASRQSRQPNKSEIRGSILDADPPPQGVTFPRRNTARATAGPSLLPREAPCVRTSCLEAPTSEWLSDAYGVGCRSCDGGREGRIGRRRTGPEASA